MALQALILLILILIFLQRLIEQNEAEIQKGLDNIFSINKATVKEGVQYDNSYAQHEIMLHIFGYGSEYLKVETYIGAMVADTKFAMKGEQLKTFTNFITKTLIPQIRGRYTNWTSFGRQIAREDFTDMKWLVPYFEKLILMDKMNTGVYQDAIERINQKKNQISISQNFKSTIGIPILPFIRTLFISFL